MADTTIAPSRGFTRWRAAGTHLLISVAIAAAALFVLLRVWYPPPLFTAEGGNDLLFTLVAVDVVIGPLITLNQQQYSRLSRQRASVPLPSG